MKKFYIIAIIFTMLSGIALAEDKPDNILDGLMDIDPNISKLFPRWTICEPSLQIEIYHAFQLLGFPDEELNKSRIVVMAAPFDGGSPDILLVQCGSAAVKSIEVKRLGRLVKRIEDRDEYCYKDIPPEKSLTKDQAEAIVNYFEPSSGSTTQAISLSLFEQSIRLGNTGVWFKSIIGNDPLGYAFWQSGETRVVMKSPLIFNDDQINTPFPNLLYFHLGVSFRIGAGVNDETSALSWVSDRTLNTGPDGKGVGGFEFHLPQHPNLGMNFNIELPFGDLHEKAIDPATYGTLPVSSSSVYFKPESEHQGIINEVVPVLRSSGQVSLFYHWWLNEDEPDNYLRFTAGVNYFEVDEYALFSEFQEENHSTVTYLLSDGVEGLETYYPEDGDWLFLKAAYRNSSGFPFGMSLQYSNQILLGHLYVPIIHPWFYFEFKYATPLRHPKPFERENFFMISPTIRLTI